MAKNNIWQWSETAASNTDIASIDITGSTGKVKDGDNAIRAMMSAIITMEGKGSDVASAGTLALETERYYHVTGTTTITDIDFTDAVDGRWAWLIFDGALTLTHSTTLKLPGSANITTVAGDRALFVQDSSDNVICLAYVRTATAPTLAASTTFYARTDGSDSNTGLANTSGGAFLTIAKALSVASNLNCDSFNVTIQVGDGTWTENIVLPVMRGTGTFTFQGNTGTPANCVLNASSGVTLSAVRSSWTVNGFELKSTDSDAIRASVGAEITLGTATRFGTTSASHMRIFRQGIVNLPASYSIVGAGGVHWYAERRGMITGSPTVALTGTPAIATFASADSQGLINVVGSSFSGAATGIRYNAQNGGAVLTGGLTLPGDAAGSGTSYGASPYGLYT